MRINSCSDRSVLKGKTSVRRLVQGDLTLFHGDMKRAHKIRLCKQCGKLIDNSGRKLQKRTKYCSNDCAEDYYFDKKLRLTELNLKYKKGK